MNKETLGLAELPCPHFDKCKLLEQKLLEERMTNVTLRARKQLNKVEKLYSWILTALYVVGVLLIANIVCTLLK